MLISYATCYLTITKNTFFGKKKMRRCRNLRGAWCVLRRFGRRLGRRGAVLSWMWSLGEMDGICHHCMIQYVIYIYTHTIMDYCKLWSAMMFVSYVFWRYLGGILQVSWRILEVSWRYLRGILEVFMWYDSDIPWRINGVVVFSILDLLKVQDDIVVCRLKDVAWCSRTFSHQGLCLCCCLVYRHARLADEEEKSSLKDAVTVGNAMWRPKKECA